jgi:hypothetical protein
MMGIAVYFAAATSHRNKPDIGNASLLRCNIRPNYERKSAPLEKSIQFGRNFSDLF